MIFKEWNMDKGLHVGTGRATITPPIGTILYGYAPGRPAEAVHDDLRVTCIAFSDGSEQAMLISADICTYHQDRADRLRRLVSDQTGMPAENVIFCTTHTHSGPAASAGAGWGTTHEDYNRKLLEPAVLEASQNACRSLKPALVGVGTCNSQTGINRRQIERDGTVTLGQNPWGPYDPQMTVVSFKTTDGEPIANLVHYGCHGTAAGNNPEITRDWSGPMVDCLERHSGSASVFFNGAIGDVGPRLPNGLTTGDLQAALALGARAGFDAVQVYRRIRDYRDVHLNTIRGDLRLPLKPLADRDTAIKAIGELGDPTRLTGMRLREYDKWEKVLREHEQAKPQRTHRVIQQTVVAVGPVVFVPFPFEMFAEITLRIRQLSPYQHTLCLSNANGSFGYFPTRDQYARGGYEIAISRNFDCYELVEQADDHAVDQNLLLLEQLADLSSS